MSYLLKVLIAVSWPCLTILSTFMLGYNWWVTALVIVNLVVAFQYIETLNAWVMKNV